MWFESMHPVWQARLSDLKPHLDEIERGLVGGPRLAPDAASVMAAFHSNPETIRVVIIGQDPYPTPGVAVGRSFAVAQNTAVPASLRNIFRELASDVGGKPPVRNLEGWEAQGVMLLNRHLTTLAGEPAAHSNLGWDKFTDAAIASLVSQSEGLVLVLWGNHAQQLLKLPILRERADTVRVHASAHPSPLSARRGFFGSKPFSAINGLLSELGISPINWNQ